MTDAQANIFYDPRGEIKLGDFGLAKFEGGFEIVDASSPSAAGDLLAVLQVHSLIWR